MNPTLIFQRSCLLLQLLSLAAWASPQTRFQEGNRAYADGDYQAAVAAYGYAPASAETYHNLGAAQYRLGRFDEARESFGAAAALADTGALRSRAWYNLGNCMVKTAEGARERDAQAALALCREAAWLYRAALHDEPDFPDAAYNLEIAQRMAATLVDEREEQQQEAEDPDAAEGESDEDSDPSEDYDMEYDESDEDADLYEPADPFGDFSEYEEIRGVPPPNQTEMDILAEELRNREQRREKRAEDYKAVDKDW